MIERSPDGTRRENPPSRARTCAGRAPNECEARRGGSSTGEWSHLAGERASGRAVAYLVAGGAARLELLGVVALAVELVLVHAVRQVDEQLRAGGALEAGRVPGHVLAEFRRHHAERARRNVAATRVAFLSRIQ